MGIDGCSVVKTLYLCLIVDFLFINLIRIFKYFTSFYEVFLLFFLNWLFVAGLVEVLFVAFPTYYDNDVHYSFNFTNYFKTLFSVFVFFTGNNSPDMFMKRYPENALLTYSFIFVIWVNNLVIIGLLIGLSYYKIKVEMGKEIKKVMQDETKKEIFDKLQNHPEASYSFIKKFLKVHLTGEQEQFISVEEKFALDRHENKITSASEFIFKVLKHDKLYELFYSILGLITAIYALVIV